MIQIGNDGNRNPITTEVNNVKQEHGFNVTFDIMRGEAVATFRIHFTEERRKNSSYTRRSVIGVYFEHGKPKGNFSNSQNVESMTNLCLFVERHTQWILERLFDIMEQENT